MRTTLECSETRKLYTIKLPDGTSEIARHWRGDFAVTCPHCGGRHPVSFKDAFIDSILESRSMLPELATRSGGNARKKRHLPSGWRE